MIADDSPTLHRKSAPLALAYAAAPLGAAALIWWGAEAGGLWAWSGLFYMTVLAFWADENLDRSLRKVAHPGLADAMLLAVAVAHFAVLYVTVSAVTSDNPLTFGERGALFFAGGLWLGQVGNAVGHELIHRRAKPSFVLGGMIYSSLLFPQHILAHRHIHHVHVATPDDPSSAPLGMGFYQAAWRAWFGNLRAALNLVIKRRAGLGLIFCLGFIGLFQWMALRVEGSAVYLALAAYAQVQIMLSDYVQHYGLRRRQLPNGRYERVGPQHAWNAPHRFTGWLLVEAGQHSAHHTRPILPFCALTTEADSPQLPRSLQTMAALALVPPLWFRIMDKRAARWAVEPAYDSARQAA